MSNMTAFKLPNGAIIAAASVNEALRIADATPAYNYLNLEADDIRACTDKELDMPRTFGGDRPAPTVREMLKDTAQPCHLVTKRPPITWH